MTTPEGFRTTLAQAAEPSVAKRCEIVRRGLLAQKWYARFIADNDLKLARTTEHYANLGDLKAMLAKYFPDWPVVMVGKARREHPTYNMGAP